MAPLCQGERPNDQPRHAQDRINSSQHAATEIAALALANPLNLRDVDSLMETSLRMRPWQLVTKMVADGRSLEEIEARCLDGAMHEARFPTNSTSAIFMMAARAEASAWAEAYELVRKMIKAEGK